VRDLKRKKKEAVGSDKEELKKDIAKLEVFFE